MATRSYTYEELCAMTNYFDLSNRIGQGSYGVVYWGGADGEDMIAVKKLHDVGPKESDDRWKKEFDNLGKLGHPNIVRMLGYCYYKEPLPKVWHEGRLVEVVRIHRLICFEYMPGLSLEERITDYLPADLNWGQCYKIIRGICEAVRYIHVELPEPMRHMDIKPSNILLDEDNNAKLADFGLSNVFRGEVTRITGSSYGSEGYIPPEYLVHRMRSSKFDIFSLGVVMLELVTGRESYRNSYDICPEQYIDQAVEMWRERYQDSFLESHREQLQTCIEIGLNCIENDRNKRPGIQDIINRLNMM